MNETELINQVRNTRDPRPWMREKAVKILVDAEYGYLVPMEILAMTPMRSRHKGKFCATRHYRSLFGYVMDDRNTAHSVWFCPAATCDVGNGRWVKMDGEIDIFTTICETCIHMEDYSDIVNRQKFQKWLTSENAQTSRRDYSVPSGARAQAVLEALMRLGMGSLEEILAIAPGKLIEDPDAAVRDLNTTSNTVYRLFKTGRIQKLGRGKKAVYYV